MMSPKSDGRWRKGSRACMESGTEHTSRVNCHRGAGAAVDAWARNSTLTLQLLTDGNLNHCRKCTVCVHAWSSQGMRPKPFV